MSHPKPSHLPSRSRAFRALIAALLAALLASCTSTSSDPISTEGRHGEPIPPDPNVAGPSPDARSASPPDELPPPRPWTEIPEAIVELQEKIQPSVEGRPAAEGRPAVEAPAAEGPASPPESSSPAEPPPPPDPETTRADVEAVLARFVEALALRDLATVRGILISRAEFDRYVTAGFIPIIEGVLARNEALVAKLEEALAGKECSPLWEPASVGLTPERGVFATSLPVSAGILRIDANGVEFEVRLDQLVKIEGAWKIFQISAR